LTPSIEPGYNSFTMRKGIAAFLSVALLLGLTPALCVCGHDSSLSTTRARYMADCCGSARASESASCPAQSCCCGSSCGSDCGHRETGGHSCPCCFTSSNPGQIPSSMPKAESLFGSSSTSPYFLASTQLTRSSLGAGNLLSAVYALDSSFQGSFCPLYLSNHSLQC
jgi:hypothetical protein